MSAHPPPPAPSLLSEALTTAIAASGCSLSELHRRLVMSGNAVSVSTLSYWRTGARRPEGAQSRVALEELERILDLPRGHLTTLIGQARRPGQVSRPGPTFSDEYEDATTYVKEALEVDPDDFLRELSSTTIATVGAGGALKEFAVRSLVQATTKRVRSLGVIVPIESGATELPRIEAVRGGHVSRQVVHPDRTVMGVRLDLDAALSAPGRALIEVSITLPDSYPPQQAVAHGSARRAIEMVVCAQFPVDDVPDWVIEFEEDGDEERELPRGTITGTAALAVRHGFGPGYFGMRWGYDDPVPRNEGVADRP